MMVQPRAMSASIFRTHFRWKYSSPTVSTSSTKKMSEAVAATAKPKRRTIPEE